RTMATRANVITKPERYRLASGKMGRTKRTKPYAPTFTVIAASTTEPPVGASTCASGSQVCTGHIGTLTAKAMKNAANSQTCVLSDSGSWYHSRIEKLPLTVYR